MAEVPLGLYTSSCGITHSQSQRPQAPGPTCTSQVRGLSSPSLSLVICSQQKALHSCSKRSLNSLGSLCPGGRDRECVAIIRGDCWEAGCHGIAGTGAALPRCPRFLACIHNHRNERHNHGAGERSSSLLTVTSLQSKVRGLWLSRRVHLGMAGEGLWCVLVTASLSSPGSSATPLCSQCWLSTGKHCS